MENTESDITHAAETLFKRGEEAIAILEKLGYNKSEIVTLSGVSRPTLYNILKFKKVTPKLSTISKLEETVYRHDPRGIGEHMKSYTAKQKEDIEEMAAQVTINVLRKLRREGVLTLAV